MKAQNQKKNDKNILWILSADNNINGNPKINIFNPTLVLIVFLLI